MKSRCAGARAVIVFLRRGNEIVSHFEMRLLTFVSMENIVPVPLEKAYRLMNVGATVLVSAHTNGDEDVMPAAWSMPLDFAPFKVGVVIDSSHYTRRLVDASGMFALQIPTVGIARETLELGSSSKNDVPDKLEKSGAAFFRKNGFEMPLVSGCAGWMIFKVLPERNNAQNYDLIMGECVAAWADKRVFADGHWRFEKAESALRTLHYVAGGHFYAIGDVLDLRNEKRD